MENYQLDLTTDVHMIKNTEWGVVAYLSQSKYGICNIDGTCKGETDTTIKVQNNNVYREYSGDIVTGCGGSDISVEHRYGGLEMCSDTHRWETLNGNGASTNHNVTGIYDMAGGRYEGVSSNMQDINGNFSDPNDYFNIIPDSKYYNSYPYMDSPFRYELGMYGDATMELKSPTSSSPAWNDDIILLSTIDKFWLARGGKAEEDDLAGIWNSYLWNGDANLIISTRSVITNN